MKVGQHSDLVVGCMTIDTTASDPGVLLGGTPWGYLASPKADLLAAAETRRNTRHGRPSHSAHGRRGFRRRSKA